MNICIDCLYYNKITNCEKKTSPVMGSCKFFAKNPTLSTPPWERKKTTVLFCDDLEFDCRETCENANNRYLCYFDAMPNSGCRNCDHYANKNILKDIKKVLKDINGKPRMDLLPWDALLEVGRVMLFGLRDHEENSWRMVNSKHYEAAMMRHYTAWRGGELKDKDSGLPHLAHMATDALFVLALSLAKPEMSDSERRLRDSLPKNESGFIHFPVNNFTPRNL